MKGEDAGHRWESLLSHGNRHQECMTRTPKSSERALRIGNRQRPPARVGNELRGERGREEEGGDRGNTSVVPPSVVRCPSVWSRW